MRVFCTLFVLFISLFIASGLKVTSANGTAFYFRTDAFVGNKNPITPFTVPVSFGGYSIPQLYSCDGIPKNVPFSSKKKNLKPN